MTDKIEVGDWVVRDTDTHLHSGLEYGVEYEVIGVDGTLLRLRGVYPEDDWQFTYCNFTKVDPPKRHKHYKEIIAWANGEEIEFLGVKGAWRAIREPSWIDTFQYRVKPEVNSRKAEIKLELKKFTKEVSRFQKELDEVRALKEAVYVKIATLTGEQAGLD